MIGNHYTGNFLLAHSFFVHLCLISRSELGADADPVSAVDRPAVLSYPIFVVLAAVLFVKRVLGHLRPESVG